MGSYTLTIYFKDKSIIEPIIEIPGFESRQGANEVGKQIHTYNPRVQSWYVTKVMEVDE